MTAEDCAEIDRIKQCFDRVIVTAHDQQQRARIAIALSQALAYSLVDLAGGDAKRSGGLLSSANALLAAEVKRLVANSQAGLVSLQKLGAVSCTDVEKA